MPSVSYYSHGHEERARDKYIRKLARETGRERLARARRAVKQARADKATATRRARALCVEARAASKEWIAKARAALREKVARMRAQLADAIAAKREAVRTCCGSDRRKVRAAHDEQIAKARDALEELKRDDAVERAWTRSQPLVMVGGKSARMQQKKEKQEERISQMRNDLTEDEFVVWQVASRKGWVRPKVRASLVETFRDWAQNHPADVRQILNEHAERDLIEAIKNEERERKEIHDLKKASRKRLRNYVARELDAVPF